MPDIAKILYEIISERSASKWSVAAHFALCRFTIDKTLFSQCPSVLPEFVPHFLQTLSAVKCTPITYL